MVTKRLFVAFLFLVCAASSFGQAFTFRDVPWIGQQFHSGVVPFSVPTDIGGMAFYWNYTDLTVGNNVVAWVDRIQGLDEHQGDATKQPTNSLLGVWFSSPSILTNVNHFVDTVGTNPKFSIWISFRPHSVGGGYKAIIVSTGGNEGFWVNGSALDFYYPVDHNLATLAADVSYEFVYSNPGTHTAGAGVGWTNGVSTASILDKGTSAWQFGDFGNDVPAEAYQGYIKFIGIWTNTTLTLTDAQNLYNYGSTH